MFAKAVSAAKAESQTSVRKLASASESATVASETKIKTVVEKKICTDSGDNDGQTNSKVRSTTLVSAATEVHVEAKVVNKENEAVTSSEEAKQKEEAEEVQPKEAPTPKRTTAIVEVKKVVQASTTVAVIPTRDGTVNHLLSLIVDRSWKRALDLELRKEYMHEIVVFLEQQKSKGCLVFPPRELIFNAFNLTPLNQVRVVLIGQDPYHGIGQAHGLCFSVNKGVKPPPSLINMYKELKTDIKSFMIPDHGCLVPWARQGVFMLNATLTVEAHKANSHSRIGWQKFTDEVIRIISRECKGVVFLLWGGFAHKKEALVDRKKHVVIKTAHPSPLSATRFFGCKCFSKTNEALSKLGRPPIDWKTL